MDTNRKSKQKRVTPEIVYRFRPDEIAAFAGQNLKRGKTNGQARLPKIGVRLSVTKRTVAL